MDSVTIRRAGAVDRVFLAEMLYEAAFSPDASRSPLHVAVQEPRNRRFLNGWPSRPGDIGVIAFQGARPIAAAWCRCFRGPEVLSPYASPGIPELAIAVVPDRRGQGVGRKLLTALGEEVSAEGLAALDLAVGVSNVSAVRLYRALGFQEVVSDGRSMRMRWRMQTAEDACVS